MRQVWKYQTVKFFSDDNVFGINLGLTANAVGDWGFPFNHVEHIGGGNETFIVQIDHAEDEGRAWHVSGFDHGEPKITPLKRVPD